VEGVLKIDDELPQVGPEDDPESVGNGTPSGDFFYLVIPAHFVTGMLYPSWSLLSKFFQPRSFSLCKQCSKDLRSAWVISIMDNFAAQGSFESPMTTRLCGVNTLPVSILSPARITPLRCRLLVKCLLV
jgi:hypothetical protein